MLRKIASFFGFGNSGDKILKGRKGEEIAVKFLKEKGYAIIERNFRVKGGEADIIAKIKNKIVVIEVKTRTTDKFGPPQSAVNKRKFKRLLLAGTLYCRKNNYPINSLQIDVVSIQVKDQEPSIRHFENINLL